MDRKILKGMLVFVIFLTLITIGNYAFAAGSFSLTKSSATITEGKTTTFKIDGSSATGKVTITSSDTSVATVSSASVWLENSSETITITAKKAGKATITVTGTVADKSGAEADITRTLSVTVEAKKTDTNSNTNTNTNTNTGTTTEKPKEKSNNAYLSTLGITPKEYDFSGFKKATLNYSVTVPYEVDSLKVLYKTADANAKVKVSGNSGFDVGSNNKITIKVTAEDGKTTKTYTIKVTKLAEEEEKPGNIIEDDNELYLTKLNIDAVNLSPEFSKDIYSYTATLDDSNIKDLTIEAEANKENAKVEILGDKNLVEGENIVNILVTLEGSTVQTVYQIVLTKQSTYSVSDVSNISGATDLISNIKNYAMIAIGIVLLIIIVVIVLIILLSKENKKLKTQENKEETNEEYEVYPNNENEFENNSVINEEVKEEIEKEIKEQTNETEPKNEGIKTIRKEKGRHSK